MSQEPRRAVSAVGVGRMMEQTWWQILVGGRPSTAYFLTTKNTKRHEIFIFGLLL